MNFVAKQRENLEAISNLGLRKGRSVTMFLEDKGIIHGRIINIDDDGLGLVDIIWNPEYPRPSCPVTTENARDLSIDTEYDMG